MDNKVSIVKCFTYDKAAEGIDKAVGLLGGWDKFIKPGMRVVIKPNLVSRKKPEEAATTHPAVLRAVIEAVTSRGASALIAESPGGAYNAAVLAGVYGGCGITAAVEGTKAKLNYDCSFTEVSCHEGKTVKSFPIIDPILDADLIISLPKLKTHAMTSFTGAVKNMFGTIPGTHKAELHFRLDDRRAFCSMLVDLYCCVNRTPVLSIMDGIVGMEGNGPTSGENRELDIILAGMNAHAVDLAACYIIDYTPDEVDTVKEAYERGLIPKSAVELEILGEDMRKLVVKDYKKPESHFNLLRLLSLPPSVNSWVIKRFAAKPMIDYDGCIGCGECFRDCPPKAIEMVSRRPVINEDKCIKCFCCQELCPQKTIKIKRSWFNRAMLKILR